MSFKNNFSKILLLTNEPIKFWDEEKKQGFILILPTIKDLYLNENLSFIINFLDQDLNEIQKMINMEIDSHYGFIHLVCSLAIKSKDFNELSIKILDGLKILLPEINFKSVLKINEIILTKDLFDDITNILFLSMDKEKTIIKDSDDEFTRIEKQTKIRAEKIRKSSKTTKDSKTSFEDMLVAILYEFPQYKIEDIMSMNLYTIYYLFKYVGKIANYEVSKIAAGNGLAKKHKYFIEK